MHIRALQPADLPMMARHRHRHTLENGRDGDVIFAPSEETYTMKDGDEKRETEALQKSVTELGWMRVWILTDEAEVWGEVTLVHRPAMPAAMHRCLMMMGIERPLRTQGWGGKLLGEAIAWARAQSSLDWITLNVFENNPSAKALYRKSGFEVAGTTVDLFRVFGQSIDDTTMVLKLR